MTNAMVAFGIAVGGASLIFYALMTRLQNRNQVRRSSGDSASAGDSATYAMGDGWTMAGWFGGHSGTHGFGNSTDNLGNPMDFGGSDFGEGGDGGGGGGGDGGD